VKTLGKLKGNQVLEAIEGQALNPAEFDWDDHEDICLRHRPSGASFAFGGSPGHYIIRYAAGDEPVLEVSKYSWDAVTVSLGLWLGAVKRDVETPDLWAELRRQNELLAGAWEQAAENTPFTPEERDEIACRLKDLGEYVSRRYTLSDQQLASLELKLDELLDATHRLGRKDWRLVVIATMLGYVVVATLPQDAGRHIFVVLLNSIGQFLGHGFPGLGSE